MSSTGAAEQYPSMGLLGCCHAWSSCICGNRHTTLHARRLQAPPDESDADSGNDSGRPAPTVVWKPPEAAMRLGMGCSSEGGEQRWQGAGEQAAGNGAGSKAHGCSYKNTASRRTAKRRKLHRGVPRCTLTPVKLIYCTCLFSVRGVVTGRFDILMEGGPNKCVDGPHGSRPA